MIPAIHSPLRQNINFQGAKIPPRTVILHSKKGKNTVSDVFVGNHVMRETFFELIIGLLTGRSGKI